MPFVESRTIRTDSGSLDLVPATIEQLRGIARYWPMELIGGDEDSDGFGLVFQHGAQEVHGIKLQPPDILEEDATVVHHVNRALIASALPYYLEKKHQGVMVPCAYYKQKPTGTVETGIALFVGPDAASVPPSAQKNDILYDGQLGSGATRMIFDMVEAIARASKKCPLPMLPLIGMDLRPRLAIGGLAMHFVIEGPHVFVTKDALQEDEPIWQWVVRAGFSKLPYAPMKPAALEGPIDDIRHV